MKQPVGVEQHLSDEQFADLLADAGDSSSRSHLRQCERCRTELAQVKAGMHSFSTLGLEWAEAQPLVSVTPHRTSLRGKQFLGPWSAAATAAAIALAIGLGTQPHRRSSAPTTAAASQVITVAEDNQLLMAIDSELRVPTQASALLGGDGVSSGSKQTGTTPGPTNQ